MSLQRTRASSNRRNHTEYKKSRGTKKCCHCAEGPRCNERVAQGVQVSPPKRFSDTGMQTSVQVFESAEYGSSILDGLQESAERSSSQLFVKGTASSESSNVSPLKAARNFNDTIKTLGFKDGITSRECLDNDKEDLRNTDLPPIRDYHKVSTETDISNLNMLLIESLSIEKDKDTDKNYTTPVLEASPHKILTNKDLALNSGKRIHRPSGSLAYLLNENPGHAKKNSLGDQTNSNLCQELVHVTEAKLNNNSMHSFRIAARTDNHHCIGYTPVAFAGSRQVQVSTETATFNVSSGSRSSAAHSSCVSHREAAQVRGERCVASKADGKSRAAHHTQFSTIEEEISEASKLSLYHTKTSSEISEKANEGKESVSLNEMKKKSEEVLSELLNVSKNKSAASKRRNEGIGADKSCKETLDLCSSDNYTNLSDFSLSKTFSEANELRRSPEGNENTDPLL
eukprot:TRINITY_DN6871_c0_g1_i1.p1 TRINITY_DN6871_c0_g1~~TRINITY_DN6871_c0_g1_i1.p1  ORF type:complete len:456 (+),score=53.31 TRINITY_DN6871_c0_g1_i1:513-1880(+)